jgi:two-component system NtrC family sensor kinase
MRLTLRFLLAAVLPVSLIILGNGYLRFEREVRLLTEEVAIHQRAVGQSLAAAAQHVWQREGQAGVAGMLTDANRREELIDIAWLEGSERLAALSPEVKAALVAGEVFVEGSPRGEHRLRSVVPVVDGDGALIGALELTEQLDREDAYLKRTLWLVGTQTLAAALAVALVMALVGWAFVARRVQALVDRIRRIGGVEDDAPAGVGREGDELDLLSHEVAIMQERLEQARAQLDEETTRRVRTVEQLRHADRLSTVGKLASGIAHELGTPLNVIIGRAQMIEAGTSTDKASEYGQVIARQGERMSGIVRQLLDFSRRRPPDARNTELQGLVEKTVTLLRAAAKKRGVELMLDAKPVQVAVDPLQIDQVVTNLVMNAIQACGQGDVVTVETGVEEGDCGDRGPCALVRVRDTGPGIAPELVEQIFDPFFTTKDVGEGTGLGLAVAHGIVTDHGGRIDVDTAPGQGANFTVHLPQQRAALVAPMHERQEKAA